MSPHGAAVAWGRAVQSQCSCFSYPCHGSLVQGSASRLTLRSRDLSVMSFFFLTSDPYASCEGKQSLEQSVLPSW